MIKRNKINKIRIDSTYLRNKAKQMTINKKAQILGNC